MFTFAHLSKPEAISANFLSSLGYSKQWHRSSSDPLHSQKIKKKVMYVGGGAGSVMKLLPNA